MIRYISHRLLFYTQIDEFKLTFYPTEAMHLSKTLVVKYQNVYESYRFSSKKHNQSKL